MDTLTELELSPAIVASAAAGDVDAFTRIVAEHHQDLVRVAYLVCGDADLAQEAVQSAWSIAWRKIGDLRDRDRLRPWLASIAANEARQLIRRRSRRTVREVDLDLAEASGDYVVTRPHQDAVLDLLRALEDLSPDDRGLLAMRYALGLTAEEIARARGIGISAVRMRLSRTVARLRKELADG